ncbi:MAG: tRNA preQ1(34) S-adenosylmethionine ribosyltransferase-isomerase QueA [Candidatus Omnitrophota bacterium]|nr:tRNA preQ1(34) S-adenosylmethionine ribosyltransferase-isomerase QueA [Candidatus Omnitrophota bacterium]
MRLEQFSYDLPPELIAQTPLKDRAQARLFVVERATGRFLHDRFQNIGTYLPLKSPLVLNNSRVIPARLLGHKERTGGKVEIFLLKRLSGGCWEAMLKPYKKVRQDDVIRFEGSSLTAEVVDREQRIVRFNRRDLRKDLDAIGHMPLPPYIRRPDSVEDREDYQTVYARPRGSVAAPTAGLHFTQELLRQLKRQGHDIRPVTLHVNLGTFKMVESEDVTRHRMHAEEFSIPGGTAAAIARARKAGRKITAVGTTSCRVLETLARTGTGKGTTDIFIYPGYEFQWVDALVTNFHLPESTLLMLVYAFGGMGLMKKAYQEAIRLKYRFYSYGDAMLII